MAMLECFECSSFMLNVENVVLWHKYATFVARHVIGAALSQATPDVVEIKVMC